jgi:DNA-binding SARP family transcriptional activator/tetratricopeptide (TPR) repeat protein
VVEVAELHRRLQAARIALLGPVEISAGGRAIPVPGRPARVLIALATAARPQSLDVLANVVWDDDPPLTHRAALHVHLGTLRRLLADAGDAAVVVRTGDRYALDQRGCELDSTLATDLVHAAHALLGPDPTTARQLVTAALGLWRGQPFTVDGGIVDVAGFRQAERLRRDAEELSVECLLAAGDATAAEDASVRLVTEEPLRETRWAQLLRARAMAGRTAEALATYQDARHTLVESLGIEPGDALRELEAAVLTGDLRSLHPPSTAATATALARPPASSGALIGRDREIASISAHLARDEAVVIMGPPGVGKTRLATEVARAMEDVVWIDVGDDAVAPAIAAVSDWVRSHPDGVVVFDNAESAPDEIASAARQLRSHAPRVAVMVTSRVPLALDAAVEVVAPLALPTDGAGEPEIEGSPAVRAVRAALAELAPATSVSSADAARLARRAGGLPILIRLVAAAARALPIEVLASHPTAAEVDAIDPAVDALLDAVGAPGRQAFLDIAVLASSFDLALGARLTGLAPGDLESVLLDLVDHGLVQAQPDDQLPYSVLPPLRDAAARSSSATNRATVLDRLADACLDRALALDTAASAGAAVDDALASLVPLVDAALEHLEVTDDSTRALALVCRLERPLYIAGWWTEKLALFDRALAIPGPPTAMRARAHVYRARPGFLHQLDAAHATAAEAIATEIDHAYLLAYARHVRSIIEWWNGRHAAAIELARDAAGRFDAAGRTAEWTEANKFAGVAMVFDGDAAGGIEVQHDTLAVARRDVDSPFLIAHHLAYLAHSHAMLGDDDAALADWTESLELCRRIGNRGTAVHVAIALADLAVDRGQADHALELVTHALDLVRAGRAWAYEPWAWTVAARAHHRAGAVDLSRGCARRALEQLPHVPPGETARLAVELAHVAAERGDAAVAARLLLVASTTEGQRELPFVPMRERVRRAELERSFGAEVDALRASGRRLTLREAAGPLLA